MVEHLVGIIIIIIIIKNRSRHGVGTSRNKQTGQDHTHHRDLCLCCQGEKKQDKYEKSHLNRKEASKEIKHES